MFECRANEEYISGVGPKLFWLILLVYTVFPVIMIVLGLTQAPFIFIPINSIIVSSGILIGAGANLFFFSQASAGMIVYIKQAQQGRSSLRRKLEWTCFEGLKWRPSLHMPDLFGIT